ncbi:MAG: hypothetical protein HYV63_34300 [Candidatus Schekmanbacteria bacterium]|nr:hypothetical protein [Candidatus Schekmanbacteria bacterium]
MKKNVLFSALTCTLLLGMMEGGARLVEGSFNRPGDVAKRDAGWQAALFSAFGGYQESDAELLWRFRANLDDPLIRTNAAHLLGPLPSTPKEPKTFRILLLGDSSPVGIGLAKREEGFGEVLASLLSARELGSLARVELVNAAVSGYSSEQVRALLASKGWGFEPDLILVYCGNNDASISGAVTDRELIGAQRLQKLRSALDNLALYRQLSNLLRGQRSGRDAATDRLVARVTAAQYGENLADIAAQAEHRGVPIIILKPPVPLLWPAGIQFKAHQHIAGQVGEPVFPARMLAILGRNIKYCVDTRRLISLYGKQWGYYTKWVYRFMHEDNLSPQDAIAHYTKELDLHPEDPVLLNDLGVSYWEASNNVEADRWLRRAYAQFVSQHREMRDDGVLAASSPFLYNIGINHLKIENDRQGLVYRPESDGWRMLDEALQADYFSLRIKRSYLAEVDKIKQSKLVSIVDLPSVFRASGGETLFIDHCHPTVRGHKIIAEQIMMVIDAKGYMNRAGIRSALLPRAAGSVGEGRI